MKSVKPRVCGIYKSKGMLSLAILGKKKSYMMEGVKTVQLVKAQ